jgi:Tol biopolymer transport system component
MSDGVVNRHNRLPGVMSRRRRLVAVAAVMLSSGLGAGIGGANAATTAPNGLIAYSSWDEDLNYDIYTVDPANPSVPPVQLTTDGHYNSNPDWSPDGTKIVFDGWGTTFGPRIQVMDSDPATDDQTVVSEPCVDGFDCYGDFQPSWSPDGSRIAFVSSRPNADGSDNWSYEIYVMDAAGEVGPLPDATRLTTDPLPDSGSGIQDSQVTWSPDGQRIAFLSTGRGADADSCDIWVMDSQDGDGDGFGDNLTRLTTDESFNCDSFEDVSPQWSPNSSLIAFTSARSGYFDIWLVNADDPTDLRNVTQTPDGYEDQPGWSPDGTQIIFRSDVSGAYELYSLPVPPPEAAAAASAAAAPAPTQLTFDGKTKQQADWGPAVRPAARYALTVRTTRGGHVQSTPAGIRCGRHCSQTYVANTHVTLKAVPAKAHRFVRWSAPCRTAGRTCVVMMTRARHVHATFVRSHHRSAI